MEEESISELLFQESETCLGEEEQEPVVNDDDAVDTLTELIESFDYDLDREEEYVEMLVEREISPFNKFKMDRSLSFDNWVKFARLEAIAWILKSRAMFGFRFQTVYLSIAYIDRFLSRRSIDKEKSWAVRLLSVACLSLAAKMEEIKVPSLSDFKTEDYTFESKVIQRMELLVLHTLEWKMISTTPFSFLHYFIMKFSNQSPPSRLLVSRTVGFILAIMEGISLTEHKPSVTAAAAVLMALDQTLTRKELERKIDSISSSGFIGSEDVFQCYNLIQKLEMENLKTPKNVNLPDFWPTRLRETNFPENSSVTASIIAKRKRLAFNNPDQTEKMQR